MWKIDPQRATIKMEIKVKKIFRTSIVLVGIISMATSAFAISAQDIVSRMETRGYTDIKISKTLFGNTSITGRVDGLKHEFVINKSGVVLREYLQDDEEDSLFCIWCDDDDDTWIKNADADDTWDDDKDSEYEREYLEKYVDIDDADSDDDER